jgi:hypothetical protein
MKAIVSTNYDPKYVFFMPIMAWAWNKLGVGVHFIVPSPFRIGGNALFEYVRRNTFVGKTKEQTSISIFDAPTENHEVTYTQVSRLFAAADTSIPDDEILITSDIDMLVFQVPPHDLNGVFSVFGADLVPPRQFPMCYVTATAAAWRKVFVKGRTLQECLDDALAAENCQNMRGNLWCRDQEILHNEITLTESILYFNRAYEGTQFATHRVDRDNHFWEQNLLNSGGGLVDAHLWRPGYTEENTEKIIRLLEIMYPLDSFHWVREYAAEFRSILNQQ